MYYYNYSFGSPAVSFFSGTVIFCIAVGIAALLGVILFFTFLRKKNEHKFSGGKKKIYNFFSFNRFYTEDIIKLIYIVGALSLTVGGLALMFTSRFLIGLAVLIVGNIALRLCCELTIILIVMVRRVVSIDRKMSQIEKFYEDDFSDWESEPSSSSCSGCGDEETARETCEGINEYEQQNGEFSCNGYCSSCGETCSPEFKAEHEIREEHKIQEENRIQENNGNEPEIKSDPEI